MTEREERSPIGDRASTAPMGLAVGLASEWTAAFVGAGDFAACCSAEVGYEDPLAIEPLSGIPALERHSSRLRAAIPDVRIERPAPALLYGDHACVPWRLAGTHSGELGLLPATDRPIALDGIHYLELIDGRVRRARGFFDLYDGAVQLGLLPARGGLGEAALMLLRGFGLRKS